MKNDRKDNLPNEMIPVYIGTGLLMFLDVILNHELYFPILLLTGVFIAFRLLLDFIKRWKAAKTDQTEEIDEVDAEFELHKDVWLPLLVIVSLIYKYMERKSVLDTFFLYASVVLAVYHLIAIVWFYVKRHRNATIQEDGASGTPEE